MSIEVKGYHCVLEELFYKNKWRCPYFSNKDGLGVSGEGDTLEEAIEEARNKLKKKGVL